MYILDIYYFVIKSTYKLFYNYSHLYNDKTNVF